MTVYHGLTGCNTKLDLLATASGDGKKTVYAHVHDGAGNISGVITASVELDTTLLRSGLST